MKKKNLKSLKLNKNSISNMNNKEVVGGTGPSFITCPFYFCISDECTSAVLPPHCFVRESEFNSCDCPGN